MHPNPCEALFALLLQLLFKLSQLTRPSSGSENQTTRLDTLSLVSPISPDDPLRKLIRDFLRWLQRCHEWEAGQQSEQLQQAQSQLIDLTNKVSEAFPAPLVTPGARDNRWNPPPIIAVVGPLTDQFQKVHAACGCPTTLMFVDKDCNQPRFPKRVSKIILWIDKLSHAWDRPAVEHVGRENVYRHRGGLKHLVDLINKLMKRV